MAVMFEHKASPALHCAPSLPAPALASLLTLPCPVIICLQPVFLTKNVCQHCQVSHKFLEPNLKTTLPHRRPSSCSVVPCRLTGRAAVRKALLSREGTLINVPSQLAEQNVAKLVAFLQPRIEAATG